MNIAGAVGYLGFHGNMDVAIALRAAELAEAGLDTRLE